MEFGLIDYSIAPHYKSNHTETELVDEMIDYYKNNHIKYKTLSDGKVLISKI